MRVIRWLLKWASRLLILLLIVVAIVYFIVGTQTGLNLVWSSVESRLPAELHVGSLKGNLISRLVIQDLSYQHDAATVSLQSLEIRWNALALLRKRLSIHDISVQGLQAIIKPGEASTTPASSEKSDFDVDNLLAWLGNIHIKQASFQDVHVKMGEALIELNGVLSDSWNLTWSVSAPSLTQLVPTLQGKLLTSGAVTGSRTEPQLQTTITLKNFDSGVVKIQSLSGRINSRVTDYLTNHTKVQVQGLSAAGARIPDFTVQSTGQLQQHAYQQQLVVTFSAVNKILATFSLPKLVKKVGVNQTFKATVTAKVQNLAQFKALLADVEEIKSFDGKLTGMFSGSGTLLHPVISGGLVLGQGDVSLQTAGVHLSNIHLNARYHTGEPIKLNGTLSMGQGLITLAGTYGIESPSLPLALTIRGDNVVALDNKEYKIIVTPDITLSHQDNDLSIKGKVTIPYADIHPLDFASTVTLPSDVVIVNDEKVSTTVPTNVTLALQIVLGKEIQIKYSGLKARLKGDLMINGVPGNPLTATGQLTIKDGTYQAYGRSLTIAEGRILYTGNLLANPGISLRATQSIKRVGLSSGSQMGEIDAAPEFAGDNKLVVGIAVNGTINKPRVTLFSEPGGLSQGDILSYLLLGYPQSQASGASSMALLGAVTDMHGGSDKKGIVDDLQDTLGLDELSVGTTEFSNPGATNPNDTQSATTVNIGRNLGHNLSMHYSVGVFQQIQVFNLRYKISKHFSFQTETSTLENGGDLLYHLESKD